LAHDSCAASRAIRERSAVMETRLRSLLRFISSKAAPARTLLIAGDQGSSSSALPATRTPASDGRGDWCSGHSGVVSTAERLETPVCAQGPGPAAKAERSRAEPGPGRSPQIGEASCAAPVPDVRASGRRHRGRCSAPWRVQRGHGRRCGRPPVGGPARRGAVPSPDAAALSGSGSRLGARRPGQPSGRTPLLAFAPTRGDGRWLSTTSVWVPATAV
jgi:hypothetical protein